jgi:hypothetical protein
VIEQIKAQLGRIVPVHEVHDLTTVEGASVERELALLQGGGSGDKRVEALRLADIFRANVVDSTLELRLRDHRHAGEDRRLRRADAPAGADRPDRGGRLVARRPLVP